ncbi:RHS repeat-associated core domain-containing protein, partial [Thermodesulfobacteriota bacterium]
ELAGRTFEQELPALPDQVAEFVWDGLDHLGRAVKGPAMAHVGVGFAYDAYYASAIPDAPQAFGQPGSESTGIRTQDEVVLWNREDLYLARGQGSIAEGWTLSPHHQMSLVDLSTLYKGDGTILVNNAHIKTDLEGYSRPWPKDVEVDAAGNVYIAAQEKVWRLDPNGNLTPVVPNTVGETDIDSPSSTARFYIPEALAMDTGGNLYISDAYTQRIRRVDTGGIVTTVAGSGPPGYGNGDFSGDGGPATQARLNQPGGIAADAWGNIYISDKYNHRIRKVDVNGIITTVAGGGTLRTDGVPATQFRLSLPEGIDIDNAGNLYIVESAGLLKLDTNGIISAVVASGQIPYADGVAVDTAGNIYVSEHRYQGRIRRINTSGIVSNFPDAGSRFSKPLGLSVDAQGNLYICLYENHRVNKIAPPFVFFGAMTPGDIAFAEETGIGHIMSGAGLHATTIDLDSGVVLRRFDYDKNNRLTAVTDPFGNRINISRDAGGVPTAITSPEGLATFLTVDAKNHLTRITQPDGSFYSFEYSAEGLLTAETEPQGNRFEHQFDGLGRLTDVTDEEGGHLAYARTAYANGDIQTQVLTAEGNLTTYLDHTDNAGVYTSNITDGTGAETLFTQSADGLTVTKSLPCGMGLQFEYAVDSEYKIKYVRNMTENTPAGLMRTTTRDKTYQDTDFNRIPDLITETVAVNGKTTTMVNDVLQSQKTVTTPEARATAIHYDPGTLLVQSVSIPGLYQTQYGYDTKGRLTSIMTNTRKTAYAYNSLGFLESVTDAQDNITTYTYDDAGRVTGINRPDGTGLEFAYDRNGNMTVLSNPFSIDHDFGYNNVNRNTSYQTPLSGSYTYTYDKDRRLVRTTFPSGKQIQNIYDTTRLAQIQTPEGNIDYTYLCGTKVESVSDGNNTIAYGYDGSLVTTETSSGILNQSLNYAYDDDFNVSSFAYAGDTANYAYDNDGFLTAAGGFSIFRNAANGLPEMVSGGDLNIGRTFNGYGEVQAQSLNINGSDIGSWTLTRDDNGRITAKSDTVDGITSNYGYTYDAMGRLLTVTKDSVQVEEYAYDANGARIFEMNLLRGISARNFNYSDEDHLLSAGTVTFQYDADGFLTIKTDGVDITTYDYSSRGELLSVTLPDGRLIEYTHDPLGRRITKKIDGVMTEKYLWQGLTRLLAIYDSDDNLLMRFEYADGRMPVAMEKNGTMYYLTYDQVESLRAVADVSGNVVKRIQYDSFGNIINDSDPSFEMPFGFAGGVYDKDTGLIRFGYRDYDPDVGRWTAKDPILFAGGDTDLYGYCLNDPVNFVDPLGLEIIWNDIVITNKAVKDTLIRLDKDLPGATIVVTAGDRYIDSVGNIRDSSTNRRSSSKARKGEHLYGNAVDFEIMNFSLSEEALLDYFDWGYWNDKYPGRSVYHGDLRHSAGCPETKQPTNR